MVKADYYKKKKKSFATTGYLLRQNKLHIIHCITIYVNIYKGDEQIAEVKTKNTWD